MASFEQQTGKTIESAFDEFDSENPQVFKQLVLEARDAKAAGLKKFSVKTILGVIRWSKMKTTGEPYKINDAFTALYARKLIRRYPEFKDSIDLRNRRAKPAEVTE